MRTVRPLSVSAGLWCIACVVCFCSFRIVFASESSQPSATSQQLPWYEALLAVKYLPEALAGVLLIAYCVNIFLGKRANDAIALAFESAFCLEGGLLDRNFSQVGSRLSGEPDIILRESMNKYSIYATGRRFCQSFDAVLDLKHRQDVFCLTTYLVSPQDDVLDIEIPMNESDMEPMCLFIAAPRVAKQMIKHLPDVQNFASQVDVSKHSPNFPTNLAVWAEFPGLFYDLITERVMELLFSRVAFEQASKCFRYLHFSTDNPEGMPRNSLKFSFVIPQEQLQDLSKCLTAVMYFIDVIGSHQLTNEQREKATKRRSRLEEHFNKNKAREQQEAFQLKKQERLLEEKEKMKRMTPEQRAKAEARQERVQMNRAMKKRMIRA